MSKAKMHPYYAGAAWRHIQEATAKSAPPSKGTRVETTWTARLSYTFSVVAATALATAWVIELGK